MTLNKAVGELIEELYNNSSNLTDAELKALDKYKMWLFGIKTTVSNNTEYWHTEEPPEPIKGDYVIEFKDGTHMIATYEEVTDGNKMFKFVEGMHSMIYYVDYDEVKWHKIPKSKETN